MSKFFQMFWHTSWLVGLIGWGLEIGLGSQILPEAQASESQHLGRQRELVEDVAIFRSLQEHLLPYGPGGKRPWGEGSPGGFSPPGQEALPPAQGIEEEIAPKSFLVQLRPGPILGDPQPAQNSEGNPSPKSAKSSILFLEEQPGTSPPGTEEHKKDRPYKKDGENRGFGEYQKPGAEREKAETAKALPQSPSAKSPVRLPEGPEWKTLAQKVHQTLQAARQMGVNTQVFTPADLMHWALVWGCEAEATYGGPGGQKVNVLAILCHNYPCADRRLLVEQDGQVAARFGYGYQTHRGQFLAVLAWARVPKDYPLQAGAQKRTVADLVQYEKLHCRSGLEQSHVLIGLSFYLETQQETAWQNDLGQAWSLERLVSEELRSPIPQAADGGMHRLLALSYAVQARRKYRLPWTPLFDQVQQYVRQWHRYALSRQNADGTWTATFGDQEADHQDWLRTLRATGLVFRWLAFSLPGEALYDDRVFRSAQALLRLLQSGRALQPASRSPQEFSSILYALDGLRLYAERALTPLADQSSSP